MDVFNALKLFMTVVASPYAVVAKRWTMWIGKERGEKGLSLLARIQRRSLLEKGESSGFLLMSPRASLVHGTALVPLSWPQQATVLHLLSWG